MAEEEVYEVSHFNEALMALVQGAIDSGILNIESKYTIQRLYAAYCLYFTHQHPELIGERTILPLSLFLLDFSRTIKFNRYYEAAPIKYDQLMQLIGDIALEPRKVRKFTSEDYRRWKSIIGELMFDLEISGDLLPTIERIDRELGESVNPYSTYSAREFEYSDPDQPINMTLGQLFSFLDTVILDDRFLDRNALEEFIYKKQ